MLESPIHSETRVIFSKKTSHKNGYTNTEHNGYTNGDLDNSEDWERDYYSDDDDVFMEGPTIDKEFASKPLMYPRHRTKVKSRRPDCKCRKITKPIVCFLCLVLSLCCLMLAILYVSKTFSNHSHSKDNNLKQLNDNVIAEPDIIGCDDIEIEDVWTIGFPKLLTESAFRLVDVNQDGFLDIIFGFGTGADGYYIPKVVCDIYFNGTYPCFGGLIALEGRTGMELWRHYAPHEMFGLNCNADLNNDGVMDCLGGGRAGVFQAVSGKDGTLLWNFGPQDAKNEIMNLYTAQIVSDLDDDGVVDILAIHGGDPLQEPGSAFRLSGRIILFSGRTGDVLEWVGVPDKKESYYSPQVYTLLDGTDVVLFGTGGETHGGALWVITLDDLYKGKITNARKIYSDNHKGVMTPPVLIDLTGDGVEDIVMSMFNSSVLAINGETFDILWNHTTPSSESYNTPSPGFYNNDTVPDFMIKYAHGPGFPLYYYSETTVLDGRTGQPLINPPIKDTVGAQASPITVSVEGQGNDIFLYWISDCQNHVGEGGKYEFVKGTNVHEQSRSDFCRLRFNTDGFSKVYALSRNIDVPGKTVYNSLERKEVEHSRWVDTAKEAQDFLRKHPEHLKEYAAYQQQEENLKKEKSHNKYKGTGSISPGQSGEYAYQQMSQNDVHRTSSKKGQNLKQSRPVDYQRFPEPLEQDDDFDQQSYKPRDQQSYKTPDYYNKGTLRNDYQRFQGNDNTGEDQYRSGEEGRYPYDYYGRDVLGSRKYNYGNRLKHRPSHRLKRNINRQDKTERHHQIKSDKKNGQDGMKYRLAKGINNKFRERKTRHVGPHDEEGIQRLLSTGTLAQSTLPVDHKNYNNSIDFVFATYWFFPAKTETLLKKDQDCIKKKLYNEKIRFEPTSKYYGMDHDAYEHVITQECLKKSGHDLPEGRTYESQSSYNAYNVHMGQMTVYRIRLTCTCKNKTGLKESDTRCSRVLPFEEQQWYAYMGNKGDSHWLQRKNSKKNNR